MFLSRRHLQPTKWKLHHLFVTIVAVVTLVNLLVIFRPSLLPDHRDSKNLILQSQNNHYEKSYHDQRLASSHKVKKELKAGPTIADSAPKKLLTLPAENKNAAIELSRQHVDNHGDGKTMLSKQKEEHHSETFIIRNSTATTNNKKKNQKPPLFSICLLTKDDLDILPEWIAYHYFVMELRHLVVAVDPTSQQDPSGVLGRFRQHLPDLYIDQWSDNDFLPSWFYANHSYGQVPFFLGVEMHDNITFEEWALAKKNFGYQKRMDMTIVNNHRFRQTTFIAKCSQYLHQRYNDNGKVASDSRRRVLVSTLDTDEYLVKNPWLQSHPTQVIRILQQEHSNVPQSGSLLQWLLDYNSCSTGISSPCIQVPRLLYGSVEDEVSPNQVSTLMMRKNVTLNDDSDNDNNNATKRKKKRKKKKPSLTKEQLQNVFLSKHNRTLNKMESIRWKYHAAYNDTRNFQQKVILDLNVIQKESPNDELWGERVNSVHRPSRKHCPPETDTGESFPTAALAANHYIGSWERYNSRKDLRRNWKRYRERSNLTYNYDPTKDSNDGSDIWMDSWLEQFVDHVGIETTSILLQEYILDEI